MIDDKTVEQARKAVVVTFFENHYGFTFAHRGGEYRCNQHQSLAVKDNRLSWFWHSKGVGGYGLLDYLMKVENMGFRKAVGTATGIAPKATKIINEPTQSKALILPNKANIPLRLYDYLCHKRGIDSNVVNQLIQEKKLYEDKRGDVVFVGSDEQKKPRFASLRETYGDCTFRMDCPGSDKRYGFAMSASNPCESLYIFESPIDAMSYASLENANAGDLEAWRRHNYLSLAGTSEAALIFFLNQRYFIKELVFCLDNDATGHESTTFMASKYAEMGYNMRILLPKHKDFNEDLQAFRAATQAAKHAKTKHTMERIEI